MDRPQDGARLYRGTLALLNGRTRLKAEQNTLGYGKDTIALQRYLKQLRVEANRRSGAVVLLLGKHEWW